MGTVVTAEIQGISRSLKPYALLGLVALLFSIPLVFLFSHFNKKNSTDLQTFFNEGRGALQLEKIILNVPEPSKFIGLSEFLNSERALTGSGDRSEATDSASFQKLILMSEIYRENILDQSSLILDPDLATFWLVETHFHSLPLLRDEIILVYFQWLYKEGLDPSFSKISAEKNLARLERHIVSLDKFIKKDAFQWSGDLSSYYTQFAQLRAATLDLFDHPDVRQFEAFFQSYSEFQKNGSRIFSDLNDARIQKLEQFSRVSAAGAFGLWMIATVLVLFFSRLISNTEFLFRRRIQSQADTIEKTRTLSTLGEFASGVGHEINNYLAVILATNELISRELGTANPQLLKHTDRIQKMGQRIGAIITSMKSLVHRNATFELQPVALMGVLDEVRLLSQSRLRSAGISLTIQSVPDDAIVLAAESELAQVFMNLVSNACDAVANSSDKQITIDCKKLNDSWIIAVHDSGPGVPAEIQEKIFESLFTTKPKGKGTGLGLSISSELVRRLGGTLALVASEKGARFEISLRAASR
jgi:signal transduction histidine kinase